jgi:hypothetical protein
MLSQMAFLDAKWLEILKASGSKTAALAVAAVLLIYLNTQKRLPVTLDHWVVEIAVIVALTCGCLSVVSVLSYLLPRARNLGTQVWQRRRRQLDVAACISQMTSGEREIVGYLLANNQRMFTNTPDCGHAATLVSKGIVVCAARAGQPVTHYEVPFEIPASIWKVLQAHASEFPRATIEAGQPHPWRRHWME